MVGWVGGGGGSVPYAVLVTPFVGSPSSPLAGFESTRPTSALVCVLFNHFRTFGQQMTKVEEAAEEEAEEEEKS